jgi:acyl carrier protein
VNNRSRATGPLLSRLKRLIADLFRMDILEPEEISDSEPLIGGSLGLDSIDVLELAFCVEEEFSVTLYRLDGSLREFSTIGRLADFIQARMPTTCLQRHNSVDTPLGVPALTWPSPI